MSTPKFIRYDGNVYRLAAYYEDEWNVEEDSEYDDMLVEQAEAAEARGYEREPTSEEEQESVERSQALQKLLDRAVPMRKPVQQLQDWEREHADQQFKQFMEQQKEKAPQLSKENFVHPPMSAELTDLDEFKF